MLPVPYLPKEKLGSLQREKFLVYLGLGLGLEGIVSLLNSGSDWVNCCCLLTIGGGGAGSGSRDLTLMDAIRGLGCVGSKIGL